MLKMLFTSVLLRDHLVRVLLVMALGCWAVTITVAYFLKKQETLLIAVSAEGSVRTVTDVDEVLQEKIEVDFIKKFLSSYLEFNESNYLERMSEATGLMSDTLFETKKEEIFQTAEQLKSLRLTQNYEIESISKSKDVFTVRAALAVKTKLQAERFLLKISMRLRAVARTAKNPHGLEITELSYEKL